MGLAPTRVKPVSPNFSHLTGALLADCGGVAIALSATIRSESERLAIPTRSR